MIAIATYRRPDGLAALLQSITSVARGELKVTIVVVDNDPACSGRQVAQSFSDVHYLTQPEPGIAAARNLALDLVVGTDAFVFVDDDEFVDPGWLAAHVAFADRSGADVVVGPVISLFPADAPRWVVAGGFIQRPIRATGSKLHGAATNNTLVRTAAWERAGRPRFESSFSATGGSDSKFFSDLVQSGAEIRFCAEAVVNEPVPKSRTTLRWLTMRAYRNGVVTGRLWSERHSRIVVVSNGLWWLLSGAVAMIWDAIRVSGLRATSFNRALNGLGAAASVTGAWVEEYARKD